MNTAHTLKDTDNVSIAYKKLSGVAVKKAGEILSAINSASPNAVIQEDIFALDDAILHIQRARLYLITQRTLNQVRGMRK